MSRAESRRRVRAAPRGSALDSGRAEL